ncbi:MAG TPA: radical SAM family heme chaperone HemW [Gemmatimonadaceae bacterium]|nr:radical SAM family heme chaperone HemW [Gemmatimonadaceae bacterium]
MTAARHLYVHVPFCSRRCSYCDFAIAVRRSVPVADYLDALAAELERRLDEAPMGPLETVYLGGGTPSKLGPDGVAGLLDSVRQAGVRNSGHLAEVTIEANPEDVTPAAAAAWRAAGVNRLSLGAQSFHEGALKWMHRTHDAGAIGRAVRVGRETGISDLSLDLIFALPAHLDRDWEADLSAAIALEPDHLSLYGLTVEPHTPLGRWAARGDVREAPEERYASEFLLAHRTLASAGFAHYEVSNFARPDHESRHNSAYWRRVPYLGIGPSAHSFDGAARRWNEREYAAWKMRAKRGEDPVAGVELLNKENERAEVVYLGLRTSEGLSTTAGDERVVEQWGTRGWAEVSGGRVVLTAEGWLRLDSLAAALTAERSR